MNREIKFRAWDKVISEMLCPKWEEDYVGGGSKKIGLIIYRSKDGVNHSSLSWCLTHPESFVIEQYIGLKDKNGKEAYDGDELNGGYDKINGGEVFWNENSGCWAERNYHAEALYLSDISGREITGTIHDTPEPKEKP